MAAEITVVVGVFVSPSSTTCFATAVIATTTAGGTGRKCIDHSAGCREHLEFYVEKTESRKTAMQPKNCIVAFRLHVKDTTLNLPPMGPTPSWQWSECLMLLGDLPMVYIILWFSLFFVPGCFR